MNIVGLYDEKSKLRDCKNLCKRKSMLAVQIFYFYFNIFKSFRFKPSFQADILDSMSKMK